MELFAGAKAVRLRGHHDKYLVAEEDEEGVRQDRNGADRAARWSVEFSPSGGGAPAPSSLRLKSCYGRYLTASHKHFLLGLTGRKVLQTLPRSLDASVEWEPLLESRSGRVRLRSRSSNHFLRANGGLPPWRNSVTHDIPHRTATQDWVFWYVDVVDLQLQLELHFPLTLPPPPPAAKEAAQSEAPVPTVMDEERKVNYRVAEEDGYVDYGVDECWFVFGGTSVAELKERLEEETGMSGISVCSWNLIDKKLHPIRVHLPPNGGEMHVVVVPASARVGEGFSTGQGYDK